MNAPAPQYSPQQMNMIARNAILDSAIEMRQAIFAQTYTPGVPGAIINVPFRNVGLIKRFYAVISGLVKQGAAETQTLTKFGPANFFSNVTLTDLSNQQRINTAGWHLHAIASARRGTAFGAAYTNDSPVNFGSNYSVIKANTSVTTEVPIFMIYEIPVAYGDFDLRGAIPAGVVNATGNLQLTVNPAFWIPSTGVDTLGVYKSSTAQAGVITNFTLTIYQEYLDQLPAGPQGLVLPQFDIGTAYILQNTVVNGLAVGADTAIPYANYRSFMSTFLIYDNQALNAGSDINYFSLSAANYTNIFKLDPQLAALLTRNLIGDDVPIGSYYFDHRRKPINTINYGNMQLNVNAKTVAGVASQLLIGFESLAQINQLVGASSVYAS